MSEEKKKSRNGCAIAFIVGLLLFSWGIPEVIGGRGMKGFFEGISGNIQALIVLGIIALILYFIYKVFLEKNN